jgi:hypothetical protein
MTRIMLICLCLGALSTVTGCYSRPAPYGTASSGVYGDNGYGVGAYQGETYKDYRARIGEGPGGGQDRAREYDQAWQWQQAHPHTPAFDGSATGP